MKSMTGYGLSRGLTSDVSIEISIRSVNGRFLENRFHLPKAFYGYESELKKKLGELVKRGTVDIYIARKVKAQTVAGKININTKLAHEYLKSFRKLARDLSLKDEVRFEMIARQPDIIQFEEPENINQSEVQTLKRTFEAALKKLDLERVREGQALKKDLVKNIKDLQKLTLKISKMRDEANRALQEKFEAKIKARIPKDAANIDPQRIAQEIVIQIEKADINEEIVRLNEHLKNFEKLIDLPVVEGKKLDFYTQELLREVNTIGSKSQVSGITESVVESKTLIERLREQVQNIE
ncbi:MAG: YicC family protein [Moraxellaceae bacterium]|nr:YicC family protein [Pseudobdellovibrionaceae bacterium]